VTAETRSTRALVPTLKKILKSRSVKQSNDADYLTLFPLVMHDITISTLSIWNASDKFSDKLVAVSLAFYISYMRFLDRRAVLLNEPRLPTCTTTGDPILANDGIADALPILANDGIADALPILANDGIADALPILANDGIADAVCSPINPNFGPTRSNSFRRPVTTVLPFALGEEPNVTTVLPFALGEEPNVTTVLPFAMGENPLVTTVLPFALDEAPPVTNVVPFALDEAPPVTNAMESAMDEAPPVTTVLPFALGEEVLVSARPDEPAIRMENDMNDRSLLRIIVPTKQRQIDKRKRYYFY
jgi:hypothetical protein